VIDDDDDKFFFYHLTHESCVYGTARDMGLCIGILYIQYTLYIYRYRYRYVNLNFSEIYLMWFSKIKLSFGTLKLYLCDSLLFYKSWFTREQYDCYVKIVVCEIFVNLFIQYDNTSYVVYTSLHNLLGNIFFV